MPIYEWPTKSLMVDWAKENISPGQTFKKSAAVQWFAKNYSKIKSNTVNMHVEGMAVNNPVRKHHSNIKAGSGHDLFYKMGPDQFRLWVPESVRQISSWSVLGTKMPAPFLISSRY